MMKSILFSVFLFTTLVLAAIPAQAGYKLMVTGDIRGEIKPCGCSEEGDLGGIERLTSYFKQKKEKTIWVDLGNFSGYPIPQGVLKTKLIAKAFQRHGLKATLPGPWDFARGEVGFEEVRVPYLLTNQKEPVPNTKTSILAHKSLEIYGYLSPEFLSRGTHRTKYLSEVDQFLDRMKQRKKAKGRTRLLLFRGNDHELAKIHAVGLFDVILSANPAASEEDQKFMREVEGEKFVMPPIKGQGILEIELGDKEALPFTSQKTVWISNKFEEDPSWKDDFGAYDKKVEQLFFEDMERQQEQKTESPYKGAEYCLQCHEKSSGNWRHSKHAHAWKTLQDVNRDFDPECVVCHSVGYQKGGFLSLKLTPKLANVQCENCHGITPPHNTFGGEWFGKLPYCNGCHANPFNEKVDPDYQKNRAPVTEKVCKECHMGSHSPNFDFNKYWPVIKHPQ